MFGNDLDTSKSKHTDLGVHMLQSQEGSILALGSRYICKYKIIFDISTSAERAQHHKIQNTSTNVSIIKKVTSILGCQTTR